VLDSFDNNPGDFLKTCKEAGIKPVVDPFSKEVPYANVYRSITPDILHQLYQGVLKQVPLRLMHGVVDCHLTTIFNILQKEFHPYLVYQDRNTTKLATFS
jgi:hypothetical protein